MTFRAYFGILMCVCKVQTASDFAKFELLVNSDQHIIQYDDSMLELFVLLLSLPLNENAFVDFNSWSADRNENQVPDLTLVIIDGIYRLSIIAFDNDEDGLLDNGFVDSNNDRKLDKLWIDGNGDGKPEKHELEKLSAEILFDEDVSNIKVFKEKFYHTDFWSAVYSNYNNKLGFIERFVDSNQDGIADVYKLISGIDNTKLITLVDLDFDGNYNMICFEQDCSSKTDFEFIPQAKQSEFPAIHFKTSNSYIKKETNH